MTSGSSLARDVAVNVVASLVASGLIAATVWAVAPSRFAIVVAVVGGALLLALVAAMVAQGLVNSDERRNLLRYVGFLLQGMLGWLVAILLPAFSRPAAENRISGWIVVGLMSLSMGFSGAFCSWLVLFSRDQLTVAGRAAFLRTVRRDRGAD